MRELNEIRAELIKQIQQPSDLFADYLGPHLYKKVLAHCGAPEGLTRERNAWRERVLEFLDNTEMLRQIDEQIEARKEAKESEFERTRKKLIKRRREARPENPRGDRNRERRRRQAALDEQNAKAEEEAEGKTKAATKKKAAKKATKKKAAKKATKKKAAKKASAKKTA